MERKVESVANYFPWYVVERSRRDTYLQRYLGMKEENLVEDRRCPKCKTPPEQLHWVHVLDDPQASDLVRTLPCREGYLHIGDAYLIQVAFPCETEG